MLTHCRSLVSPPGQGTGLFGKPDWNVINSEGVRAFVAQGQAPRCCPSWPRKPAVGKLESQRAPEGFSSPAAELGMFLGRPGSTEAPAQLGPLNQRRDPGLIWEGGGGEELERCLRDKAKKGWIFEHLSSQGPSASLQSWIHLANVKRGGPVGPLPDPSSLLAHSSLQ